MGLDKAWRKFAAKGSLDARGGLYSGGVPVFGSDRLLAGGSVFHVGSTLTGASDNNSGKTPDRALATIDAAINKTTASKGDLIVVHEGHAETITGAAGIALDVAGVSIVGLGQGALRPTVTFGTAAAASCDISAASTRVSNILFLNDIDSQTAMINITADDVTIEGCEFREGSAKQALIFINIGAANNDADRTKIYGCKFVSVATGATSAISLTQLQDGVEIVGNYIDGDFDDAGIQNPTGEICTNLLLKDNIVSNRQTGDHAIQLVSACTGLAIGNMMYADTLGTIFDPGSLKCLDNFETDAIDQAGVASPRVSAGGLPDDSLTLAAIADDTHLGADNNNNDYASTNVVANEDGSILERLEQIQEATNKGTGTALAANKSLVDALGTDGTTVTDAAASVLGAIGADSANNSFASTLVAANEDGSVLERLEQLQEAVNKGTGTALAANKSLVDALGTDGTTVTDAAASVLGAIGADSANNSFASTLIAANEDGSVLERLEQIQEAVNKGTGTALAANKSLVDVLGTDGTTVTDAAASVLGAIGADNANNAFASTSIAANEDGSVLERLEQLQEAVNRGTGTSLAANESLVDVLYAANGIATFPAAAAPANGVSIAEVLRQVYDQTLGSWRLARSDWDFTVDTGAAAAYTVFTVTGVVLMQIFGVCATSITAGGATTIELGVSGNTAVFIAQIVDGRDLLVNEIWLDATPTTTVENVNMEANRGFIVTNGQDVSFLIGAGGLTAGKIDFYCLWKPMSSDGNVVAA